MLVFIAAFALVAQQFVLPIVAAESADSSIVADLPIDDSSKPAAPEALLLTNGAASPISPTDIKGSAAVLRWTPTGSDEVQDTYNIRLSASADVDDSTGALHTPLQEQLGLSTAEYAVAPGLSDGAYYWQLQSCGQTEQCDSWTEPWMFNLDSVAPVIPTAAVKSGPYTTFVRLAGTADVSTKVTVKSDNQTCTTAVANDGSWTCTFDTPFEFGEYTALIRSNDLAGNESDATEVMFTVAEQFIAPAITSAELPDSLDVIPIVQTARNEVASIPVTSKIDVINRGTADDSDSKILGVIAPPSVDGGIVQSSENGWRVLGLPWFVWLGSVAGLTAGWWMFGAPGSRRIGILQS